MKKTFTLLILMTLMVLAAHGETIDVDSLRYTLNTDGTATVSSCLYKWTPNITIPQTVNDGTQDYTVTKIGDNAFDGRSFITSVTFPETLEEMGFYSFRYCSKLTSLNIPASLKAFSSSNFSECTNLETVTVAAGSQMTKIDEAAFYNCNKMTSINLPSTITEMGKSAFYNCQSLTSVTLPSSLTAMGEYAFYKTALTTVAIPSGVTNLQRYVFAYCDHLSSVTLQEGLTNIEYAAFYDDDVLDGVVIPSTVTSIGDYAFGNCKGLTAINIPAGVTTIGNYAFQSCYLLETVDMKPATMTSIGRNAFDDCRVLKAFRVPEGVTELGQSVFWGCKALQELTFPSTLKTLGLRVCYNCSSLTSITLPDALTTIGEQAFEQCSSLTSITLPEAVTTIGPSAFKECSSLTSVNIPSAVTSIGNYAFYNCTKLSSDITLPITLTSLGTYAFSHCEAVGKVTFLGDGDVTLPGESQFSGMKSLKSIKLPAHLSMLSRSMFYGNTTMENVNLSSTQVTNIYPYAFYQCKALASVQLPATLETIGENAFAYCENLTAATFPTALKSIGSEAFRNTSLTSLQLNNGLESIGNNAFSNCNQMTSAIFPEMLTTMGTYVLSGCSNLQTVVFPKNLTTIPYASCYQCKNLADVTLPPNVETIGGYAFHEANALKAVTLPATVKVIEQYAFYHTLMPSLTLNKGLETIGRNAFTHCDRLKELTLPSTLKQMDQNAFSWCDSIYTITFAENMEGLTINGSNHFESNTCLRKVTLPKTGMTTIPNGMFKDCDHLRNIELPATITSISDYAFYACDSLQTIYIPDAVKSIGYETFCYCKGLRYVRLPEGLESIGQSCFGYTEKLPFINIPSTVTSIGNWAIHTTASSSNTNFKSIGIMGSTMPGTKDHVFWQYQPAFSLLVPEGQEEDYQNSTSWTPDATDNRTIKGYPAEKQTLTQDLIHLSCLDKEHYKTGSPEAVWIDWFEGMGNYHIYYTDAKGNKTTAMPTENGEYTISVDFEEGPYYKPATFNNIATFALQEIANEDFALLWDFYSKTYDRTKQKSTWTGNGGGGAPANWGLIEGVKESAVGIFGVKWNNGHVEEINFGTGTSIYNLNADETPVSLFALPQVKKIEIAGCELYGNISDKVEEWLASGKTLSPTLAYLDLQRNKLEGNIATLVGALPSLKTLDVHENRFSSLWPAFPETLENVNISTQTITDITAKLDLRDMTDEGFFSTLPSIVFYDPATRTYADDIKVNVQSQTNWSTFTLNYNGSNDFTVSGSCTWKGASGDIAKCSYTDSKNKTTTFNANFFYDMGDVDFNGLCNISDLQQSISYLFKETYSNYYRYNFSAGDMNADNAINVLDIVPHVDLLLSMNSLTPNPSPTGKATGWRPQVGKEGSSQSSRTSRTNQTSQTSLPEQTMAEASLYQQGGKLILKTSRAVAAMDIFISPVDHFTTSSLQGMTMAKKTMEDGQLHLIIYNTAGKTLPTGETVIGTCSTTATVTGAMLVDEEAQPINTKLNDSAATPTGLNSLTPAPSPTGEGSRNIYSLDGRKIVNGSLTDGTLPKGVYIINGKKVVIK